MSGGLVFIYSFWAGGLCAPFPGMVDRSRGGLGDLYLLREERELREKRPVTFRSCWLMLRLFGRLQAEMKNEAPQACSLPGDTRLR